MKKRKDYHATHRCAGSLHNCCSIRLVQDYGDESPMAWKLYKTEYDFEWSGYYMDEIGEIFYCPWCGKRL